MSDPELDEAGAEQPELRRKHRALERSAPELEWDFMRGSEDGMSPWERAPSRVEQLQRRAGNGALLQRRRRLQRRTFSGDQTPQWMKDQVGITPESERHFAQAEAVEQAAGELQIPAGGRSLDPIMRSYAEQDLGVSLGDVSLVEKGGAAAGSIEALAFATSDDHGRPSVVLADDVDLGTEDGQFTLMHELAHVAQQKHGKAEGLDGLGGDPAVRERLERGADADASRILQRMRADE
jgi:hypothetical protein